MFNGIQMLITGGLGNQMFQYALARQLSIRTGLPLILDTSPLSESSLWGFDLRHFRLSKHRISRLPWIAFRARRKFLRTMHSLAIGRSRIRIETSSAYDPEILQIDGPCLLEGFWQSERYFRAIADQLREDFRITQEQDLRSDECEQRIRDKKSVGLHIRRGDFISDPQARVFHGTCSKEYYDAALEMVLSKIGRDVALFVFSDDMEWCRTYVRYPIPTTYVDWNADRPFEDMRLLSSCTAQIIANSTFSWWAAWLNPRADKVVIAPKRWYLPQDFPCELPNSPWLIAI